MTPTKPKDKKKKKLLEIDSEYEDLLSEQLDTFTSRSPSGKPEPPRQVDIQKVEKTRKIVMGKKVNVLATALTPEENRELQHKIKEFTANI